MRAMPRRCLHAAASSDAERHYHASARRDAAIRADARAARFLMLSLRTLMLRGATCPRHAQRCPEPTHATCSVEH